MGEGGRIFIMLCRLGICRRSYLDSCTRSERVSRARLPDWKWLFTHSCLVSAPGKKMSLREKETRMEREIRKGSIRSPFSRCRLHVLLGVGLFSRLVI